MTRTFVLALLAAVLNSSLVPLGLPESLTSHPVQGSAPQSFSGISLARGKEGLELAFAGIENGHLGIYWRRRAPGSDWSETVRISANDGRHAFAPSLWVNSDGGSSCAWTTRDPDQPIYRVYSSYRPPGDDAAWGVPQFLAVAGRAEPRLIGDHAGNLFVYFPTRNQQAAWGTIAVFGSRDAGRSWTALDPRFPAQERQGRAGDPQAAALPGGLAMIWLDDTPASRALVFNRTDDGGRSWLSRPVTVHFNPSRSLSQPRLLASGNRLHVSWVERLITPRGRRIEVWTAFSSDRGLTWSEGRKVYESPARDLEMALFPDGPDGVGWVASEPIPSAAQPPGPEGGRLLVMLMGNQEALATTHESTEIQRSPDHEYADLQVTTTSDQQNLILVRQQSPLEPSRILSFLRIGTDFESGPQIQASNSNHEVVYPAASFDPESSTFAVVFHEQMRRASLLLPPPSTSTIRWQRFRLTGSSRP